MKSPKDYSIQIKAKFKIIKPNVKKLGFATDLTAILLYLGCMLIMLTVGYEGTVKFFNSLLYGLNVSSIFRMNVSLWEVDIGIVQTFILGWLIVACIGVLYNWQIKKIKML